MEFIYKHTIFVQNHRTLVDGILAEELKKFKTKEGWVPEPGIPNTRRQAQGGVELTQKIGILKKTVGEKLMKILQISGLLAALATFLILIF